MEIEEPRKKAPDIQLGEDISALSAHELELRIVRLEEEISRNGWLTVGADPEILFSLPIEERYTAAMRLLGIDPLMLTSEAGHA